MEIRKGYIMGTKMSDEALDKLFEGMSRGAQKAIDNQHTPTKRATVKKAPAKKAVTTKK